MAGQRRSVIAPKTLASRDQKKPFQKVVETNIIFKNTDERPNKTPAKMSKIVELRAKRRCDINNVPMTKRIKAGVKLAGSWDLKIREPKIKVETAHTAPTAGATSEASQSLSDL